MSAFEPLTKRELRELRELVREPGIRREQNAIVLEGRRIIEDALAHGIAIRDVVFDADRIARDAALRKIAETARAKGIAVGVAPADRFAKISSLRTPPGVLAIADRPAFDFDAILARDHIRLVAAIGLQDPTNVGALIRNALAFSVDALLVTPETADPYGPRATRAASGTVLELPIFERDARAVRTIANDHDMHVYAADSHQGEPIDTVDFAPRSLVVFGAEAAGLPDDFLEADDVRVRIPIDARVESLNVTSAAAILLHRFRGSECAE